MDADEKHSLTQIKVFVEGRYRKLCRDLPQTVFFCDYASVGNTWHRDNYYRTWFPEEYAPTE